MSPLARRVAFGLFIIGWGTNVATPLLVRYRERLDLGDNQTQLIFVIYVSGILCALLVAGQLSDRFGRRAVFLPALAVSGLASLFIIFGRDSLAWLLVGRVLLGLVSGASLGVGAAWLLELMGPGQATRAAVITTVATYGGFGIGPPITLLWDEFIGSPLIGPFVLHIALAIATIPLLRSVPETAPPRPPDEPRWRPELRLGVPRAVRRTFWWVLAPATVWVFAFPSTGFALFPVLVSDAVDVSDVLIAGLAGAITAWGGIAARPLLARLGTDRAIPVGLVMGSTGYLLGAIAWQASAWLAVWPAALLLGAASGVVSSAGLALVGQMSDDESRGALTSTFYLLAYLGMAMPLVITTLGGAIGVESVLVMVIVGSAATALTHRARSRIAA